MNNQPTESRFNTLADELEKARAEAERAGQTQIERDYYITEFPGLDGQFNLLARPAPPASRRRDTDSRPTGTVSIEFGPPPISEGVTRLLEMKERIDHLMQPVLRQPPPSE